MFSQEPRCQYENNQLAEVICQLRFPEILTINANPPVDFQEHIRSEFPQYAVRAEAPAPGPNPNRQPIQNYQFATADNAWRINLTSRFISLSCNRYTNWETFAKKLDKPLAAFIKVYSPAYFERIGLRYLNFFSRKELSLEGVPFRDLFQDCYLGLLGDEELHETTASRSSVDAELAIRGGCRVKLHAGPGLVKRGNVEDKEVKFIFDQDLFMNGNVPVNYAAASLETLHGKAFSIFRGAITDTLHDAMEPKSL